MRVIDTIREEIRSAMEDEVTLNDGITRVNIYKKCKELLRLQNKQYLHGNIDSQGNYKYWYDILTSLADNERKNLDFDSRDPMLANDSTKPDVGLFLANLRFRKELRDTYEGVRINDALDTFCVLGNLLSKKDESEPTGYKVLETNSYFVTNQAAKKLSETAIVEYSQMISPTMLANPVWDKEAIKEAIDEKFGNQGMISDLQGLTRHNVSILYYDVVERNGYLPKDQYLEAKGLDSTEEDAYEMVYCRIVAVLNKKGISGGESGGKILFAGILNTPCYAEGHRGVYKGCWWREGLIEQVADFMVRANEIGNAIARCLEFSHHKIFASEDETIYQNVLTDLKRGDIIHTKGLKQVDTTMHDITNYISEWNMIIEAARRVSNYNEISQGNTPAGTPFKLGSLLDLNSMKYFEHLREKVELFYRETYEQFTLPFLFKKFTNEDIIEITGDADYIRKYHEILADTWYNNNLPIFGAHDDKVAETIKEDMMEKLKSRPKEIVRVSREFWNSIRKKVSVIIVGESMNIASDLATLGTFTEMEADPVRRTALIEMAMKMKGIDVSALPKADPAMLNGTNPDENMNKIKDAAMIAKQPVAK